MENNHGRNTSLTPDISAGGSRFKSPAAATIPGIELSVIVPTFNERDNVREVVKRLAACLGQTAWEVIFVDDDSPDGTAELVRAIGRNDHRVRCLQRLGRRGLSSACIEGMLASSAPYLAVMDADLQHDETLLARMLTLLQHDDTLDVVVGSRYVDGGSVGQWDHARADYSRFATRLSRFVLKSDVRDPLSGFFMIRRRIVDETAKRLSGIGFKVLLDLLASSRRPLRVIELPYTFRPRQAGESKLDSRAVWDYLMLLLDKRFGHLLPVRFLAFSLVGSIGVLVHLLILFLWFKGLQGGFVVGQAVATLMAMTSNFTLNNILTYRDMHLSGRQWLRGLGSFILVCSIGALANVGVAAYLFHLQTFWVVSAVAGILVGVVWNYAVSAVYTWKNA
jgi:dolichol-phosphate mannosyltransferase